MKAKQTKIKIEASDAAIALFNMEPLTSRQKLREKMRQAGRYHGIIKKPILLDQKNVYSITIAAA